MHGWVPMQQLDTLTTCLVLYSHRISSPCCFSITSLAAQRPPLSCSLQASQLCSYMVRILRCCLLCCAVQNGSWDEVSGEAFLRKLLSMPIEEAKFNTVSSQHWLHQLQNSGLSAPMHSAVAAGWEHRE